MKRIITRAICLTVLPIAVFSIQQWSSMKIGGTAFWWAIEFLIIVIFFVALFIFGFKEVKKGKIPILIFISWMLFSIIRGFFEAEIYWDHKSLIEHSFGLLLPIAVFSLANIKLLQNLLSFFVKYGLLLAIPILLPQGLGIWGWYLFPICLLLFFLPTLKKQWVLLLIGVAIIVSLGNLANRSHMIKYMIPILLLGLYYFRFFIASNIIIKIGIKVLLFTPWILFILGVSGIFNVFRMDEYIKSDFKTETTNSKGEPLTAELTEDSRTFMYEETLNSAKKYNYWLIGRSPARGNETVAFADILLEITGRAERPSNEAGIPNFFTWTGVIGVILYFIVFYKATHLAVNKSNNMYSKIIGLYTAFIWAYTWIENPGFFNMSTFTTCLFLAVCFSDSFRNMNNMEVKLWARGIFDNRYIELINYFDGTKKFELSVNKF